MIGIFSNEVIRVTIQRRETQSKCDKSASLAEEFVLYSGIIDHIFQIFVTILNIRMTSPGVGCQKVLLTHHKAKCVDLWETPCRQL